MCTCEILNVSCNSAYHFACRHSFNVQFFIVFCCAYAILNVFFYIYYNHVNMYRKKRKRERKKWGEWGGSVGEKKCVCGGGNMDERDKISKVYKMGIKTILNVVEKRINAPSRQTL